MKLWDFCSSLLSTNDKEKIIEDIRITSGEIKEHTAPAYESAITFLKGWKFKSEQISTLNDTFNRMVDTQRGENCVVTIEKSFKDILENLTHVEKMIDKTYSSEVAIGGLTYQKAALLQYVEMVGFVSKFARKFLIYVYICETAMYEDSGTVITDSLSPVEIDWLNNNFVSFCTAFNIAAGNPAHVEKQLANIPDIEVTKENYETLPETMGMAKIDPFQMGLIPTWLNPVYHIGIRVAEWQADRYKVAKEEVRLLQLRKLNMENLIAKKPDAHIQKEIAYMETRIQDMNFKIAKMEQSAGL